MPTSREERAVLLCQPAGVSNAPRPQAGCGDTLVSPLFSVIRIAERRFLRFFRGAERTSPEELLHAARVLLWVRVCLAG